jgi:hypothetical protein
VIDVDELERAGDEMERRAQRNLSRARRDLAAYAAAMRDLRESYTPMADAVPTRSEVSVIAENPQWMYLFERAGRVRAAIPEEEAYYEDRRRSGAWPDLYATPDLPSPANMSPSGTLDAVRAGKLEATGPEPCPPAGPVAQPDDDDPPPELDERGEEALANFNALHDAQPDEDGDLG